MQGIWFCAAGVAGNHRLLPAMIGSVPLDFSVLPALPSLPSSWAPPASATPAEKVMRELAAALESVPAGSPLWAEFLSQTPAEPASSLRSLYRRMQESSSPVVSTAGLAGLLRSGDVQALSSLTAHLGRGPLPAGGPSLAQAVCEYFNGNSRGLPILAALASAASPSPQLRHCAAYALRNIHSRESIPFLSGLLDSDDPSVRYEGVAGLASYANSGFVPQERPLTVDDAVQPRYRKSLRTTATSEHFPTVDVFLRDEARIISFWKRWVREDFAAAAVP